VARVIADTAIERNLVRRPVTPLFQEWQVSVDAIPVEPVMIVLQP
jgi:RNase P protein component